MSDKMLLKLTYWCVVIGNKRVDMSQINWCQIVLEEKWERS